MEIEKVREIISWLSPIFMLLITMYIFTIAILSQLSQILFKEVFLIITLTMITASFLGIQIDKTSKFAYLKNRFLDIGILMLISLLSGLFYINFEKETLFGVLSISASIVGLFYLLIILFMARIKK
jgi:hypothetical protein